jgi:hypothetical protein
LCNIKISEESVKNQDSEFSLIYHHLTSVGWYFLDKWISFSTSRLGK